MDDWGMEDNTITTAEIDHAIELMAKFREEYDEAKSKSNSFYKNYEEQKAKVVVLLTKSGKTKYIHETVGNVSLRVKKTIRVPKDFDSRRTVFEHLESEMGRDAFINKFTLNSASLNSYYKEQHELDSTYELPGVGGYNETVELSLRRKK